MKRLLSIVLTFALTMGIFTCVPVLAHEPVIPTESEYPIGMPVPVVPAEDTTEPAPKDPGEESEPVVLPFTDVWESHWFYPDVCFVYANKIMKGTSNTEFMPGRTLTRGEAVTALYRISGSPEIVGESHFTDVPSGEYYYIPVLWAEENGIVTGMTESTFCPKDPITREQIATIFFRYYATFIDKEVSFSGDLSAFPDQDMVLEYARDAISWAVDCKLMRGIADSITVRLAPKASTTRAQLAALLTRLCAMDGVMNPPGDEDEGSNGEDENDICDSSQAIIEFIKEREGFRVNPYWDHSQWSVGYGTCCRDEEGNRVTSNADKDKIADKYWNLTREAAEILLKEALAAEYEPIVRNFAAKHSLEFTQNQFDALVSFTYNLGSAWTSSSYKLSRLLSGKGEYAEGYTHLQFLDAYGSWCRVSGKVSVGTCERRLKEAAIFLYGDYDYANPKFTFVRYDGNGSYLTTSNSTGNTYTDAVAYFTIGEPYGELLTPQWTPADEGDTSQKVFLGWFTGDGIQVTAETIVKSNCTLIAKWGDA